MDEAICCRTTGSGNSAPLSTIVSSRLIISAVLLACPVERLPSWPVFIACSMSSASAPRTSPTTIRLGRIRSEDRIKSRTVISPFPSVFAFRVSSDTRFGTVTICNSAESSIVITLSSDGINWDKAFKNVVFPEPVPPLIKMLYLLRTSRCSSSAASSLSEPIETNCSIVSGRSGNLRIVIVGPFKATGGRTILTRDPSRSRASTIGDDSFTIRLTPDTIVWMMSSKRSRDSKRTGIRLTCPSRSTNISSWLLIIISVTQRSSTSG
ncbi:hypothetical protein D3C81_952810 [compost metagenome]